MNDIDTTSDVESIDYIREGVEELKVCPPLCYFVRVSPSSTMVLPALTVIEEVLTRRYFPSFTCFVTGLGLGVWPNTRVYLHAREAVWLGFGCKSLDWSTIRQMKLTDRVQKAEINSKHGIIQAVNLTSPDVYGSELTALADTLLGARYGPASIGNTSRLGNDTDAKVEMVISWLRDEMSRWSHEATLCLIRNGPHCIRGTYRLLYAVLMTPIE